MSRSHNLFASPLLLLFLLPPETVSELAAQTIYIPAPAVQAGAQARSRAPDANAPTDQAPATIGQALASPACAPGCTVVVPQSYPFGAEVSGIQGFLRNPSQPQTHVIDSIGGSEYHTFSDTNAVGPNFASYGLNANCLSRTQTFETFCGDFHHRITSPGYALSNTNGTNLSQWFVTHGLGVQVDSAAAGIAGGLNIFLNHYGTGDTNNYWYVGSKGGWREGSGEHHQGFSLNSIELAGAYTGTITASSGYTLSTTTAGGGGTQGVGRYLIDISAPLAQGCVTAQGTLPGLGVSVYTLGCGAAALPASHAWGTLAGDAHQVALIPSRGGNGVTTPTGVTVNLMGGTGFVVGDLVTVTGDAEETVQVLAVQEPTGGQQGVTLSLSRTHSAGAIVMQTDFGAAGLDVIANHIEVPGQASPQRYVIDVLGAVASNQVVGTLFIAGSPQPVPAGNLRLAQFATVAGNPVRNVAGVVTLSIVPEAFVSDPYLNSYPLLTITGATNPALNGPCTNVHRVPNGYPALLQCTKNDASVGQTSASAHFSIGSTGYGNSNFVLYPMSKVLDVQDYAIAPPAMDGTFRLEPFFASAFVPGDNVEEPNDISAGYTGFQVGLGVGNPFAYAAPGLIGYSGSSPYGLHLQNNAPPSVYAGLGGLAGAPVGLGVTGVHSGFGGMDQAPWPSGKPFLYAHCPPSALGCNDPLYSFQTFEADGGQGFHLKTTWTPAAGVFDISAPHVTLPQAPLVTGAKLYVCAEPTTGEIVRKVGPCDRP